MKLEYSYSKIRGKYFPIVPICLVAKECVDTFALIDCGASISIFKPAIAHQLGIELEKGVHVLMEGISGKISVYVHKIDVRVEDYEFKCKIGFSNEYTASLNLLGRDNFFEQFLITIDEKNKKIILER